MTAHTAPTRQSKGIDIVAKIVLAEKPTSACNRPLFENLPGAKQRYEFLCRYSQASDVRLLKSLAYGAYLQTLHWAIIRAYVLASREPKCELCSSTSNLQVHHRNYQFRGEEFRDLSALVIECESCHKSGHLEAKAKSDEEHMTALLEKISLSKKLPRSPSKRNLNYDPRTVMNLKTYGDIRGYQGRGNDD